ncbi:MAG: gluconate 2-dehydrogenase subunit 3 family protein [Candidatus Thiodiazotropha sp.]
MTLRRNITNRGDVPALATWREQLLDRRRFLLGLAGGSLASLLPLPAGAAARPLEEADRWDLIARVQDRLFPSEPEAPGAREINALSYLQWVVGDRNIDAQERAFILQGCDWLESLSRERHGQGFAALDAERQEQLLESIARSESGENWLSTLLLYLLEALLSDPVYGANPDAVGWRWLQHRPGFPRPNQHNRYRAG